jgi:hypothetical protein
MGTGDPSGTAPALTFFLSQHLAAKQAWEETVALLQGGPTYHNIDGEKCESPEATLNVVG